MGPGPAAPPRGRPAAARPSLIVGVGFVLYLIYAEVVPDPAHICEYCTGVHVITFPAVLFHGGWPARPCGGLGERGAPAPFRQGQAPGEIRAVRAEGVFYRGPCVVRLGLLDQVSGHGVPPVSRPLIRVPRPAHPGTQAGVGEQPAGGPRRASSSPEHPVRVPAGYPARSSSTRLRVVVLVPRTTAGQIIGLAEVAGASVVVLLPTVGDHQVGLAGSPASAGTNSRPPTCLVRQVDLGRGSGPLDTMLPVAACRRGSPPRPTHQLHVRRPPGIPGSGRSAPRNGPASDGGSSNSSSVSRTEESSRCHDGT